MRAWIALGVLFLANPVWAQSEGDQMPVFADEDPNANTNQTNNTNNENQGYPSQGNYPTAQCAGGCPAGMACSADGVCEQVPSCAGGCPQGMVCSPDGVCEAAPPPPAPMCTCPTGFVCTPAGTCAPQLQAVQPRPVDPGAANKARRRSTLGFISSGLVLALGVTAGVVRSGQASTDSFHAETPILFAAALYHGVAGLLTYGGSRAARRAGGRGVGFLRIMGWITWIGGLAGLLISAGVAAYDGSTPSSFIIGSAGVAALAPLFWAIDARIGARQADELAAQQQQARRWAPSIGLLRDGETNIVGGTLGATFEL